MGNQYSMIARNFESILEFVDKASAEEVVEFFSVFSKTEKFSELEKKSPKKMTEEELICYAYFCHFDLDVQNHELLENAINRLRPKLHLETLDNLDIIANMLKIKVTYDSRYLNHCTINNVTGPYFNVIMSIHHRKNNRYLNLFQSSLSLVASSDDVAELGRRNLECQHVQIREDTYLSGFKFCHLIIDFKKCDFRWVNFSQGILPGNDYSNANFYSANLSNTLLYGARLDDANLSCANLKKAQLSDYFRGGYESASLINANLERADLEGARLNKANLSNANLSNANLKDTDFSSAILKAAHLKGANLDRTKFYQANLIGVDFDGVDLSNVEGIKEAILIECHDPDNLMQEMELFFNKYKNHPNRSILNEAMLETITHYIDSNAIAKKDNTVLEKWSHLFQSEKWQEFYKNICFSISKKNIGLYAKSYERNIEQAIQHLINKINDHAMCTLRFKPRS